MSAASTSEPAPTPAWVGEVVDAYAAHLLRERDRSEHTIRAYAGDVRACLMWCAHDGSDALADVTLAQDVILLPGIHGCDLAAKAGYPSLSVPLPAPAAALRDAAFFLLSGPKSFVKGRGMFICT